jgi:hypothetical protein
MAPRHGDEETMTTILGAFAGALLLTWGSASLAAR